MAPAATTPGNSGLRDRTRRFFYAEEVPYTLALIRIVLPLVLFLVMLARWQYARELYSADGAPSQLSYSYGWGNLLPEFPGSVAVALFTAMLFFLLTSSIGWCTRISLFAATILYTYFNLLDSIGTMTKYSVIASHVMLLLCFSGCGASWSIDSRLQGTRRKNPWPGEPSLRRPKSPVWPRRLIQLLIGFVYFGAAITNMHAPEFFTGNHLMFWMVTNVNHQHPLGESLSQFPAVLIIFAYAAVVWQVVFMFLVWKGWGRVCMLSLGVIFHLMTALTLGLYVFPVICVITYLSFFGEQDVRNLAYRWRRLSRKRGWHRDRSVPLTSRLPSVSIPPSLRFPSPAVMAFAAVLLTVLGTEVEYRMDPYGLRGPDGPLALRELDPEKRRLDSGNHERDSELIRALTGPETPLRLEDQFFAFDVGTTLVGKTLVNRRREFRHGETLIAQCILNSPHDDMCVECNLHDAEDRLVDRVRSLISREMPRSNHFYRLPESLEPGDYFLVLKSAGREICRRKITLRPGVKSPLAN